MFTNLLLVLFGLALVVAILNLRNWWKTRTKDVTNSSVVKITAAELEHRRRMSDKPIVVMFFASWCSSCAAQTPTFRAVGESMKADFDFVVIDIDDEQSLATRMEVKRIPTIMVLKGTGPALARNVGVLFEDQLKEFVLKAVA